MNAQWTKTASSEFEMIVDSVPVARISVSNKETRFFLGEQTLLIRKKGTFSSTLVVLNESNETVTSIEPKNWFGRSYRFTWKGQQYELRVGNNPLVEWSVLSGTDLIKAYGVDASGKGIQLRVTGQNPSDPFFDCLLFYLIRPVMHEQMGADDFFVLSILGSTSA